MSLLAPLLPPLLLPRLSSLSHPLTPPNHPSTVVLTLDTVRSATANVTRVTVDPQFASHSDRLPSAVVLVVTSSTEDSAEASTEDMVTTANRSTRSAMTTPLPKDMATRDQTASDGNALAPSDPVISRPTTLPPLMPTGSTPPRRLRPSEPLASSISSATLTPPVASPLPRSLVT